jgi:tripartite-type tricarboxylate transporter receptor subunit TctC
MNAKRAVLCMALVTGIAVAIAGSAAAQIYPNRPIKLIVPFPAGGPPDTVARLIADRMTGRLGQAVVIDNRPGAGATIGTRLAAHAEPDGYTLMFASTTSLSIGPVLFKNLDYDPAKAFTPVASVSIGAMVVTINPQVPAQTVAELVAHAKANPGSLHNGSGVASPAQIAWGLFTHMTGTQIVHVPYRSMSTAMTDLVAGQIQMMIDGIGSLLPHIQDGKVRALAVTGTTRSRDLPNVPTMIESGYPDYVLQFWTGILAPAGTPSDVVRRLNAAINASLMSEDTRESLARFNVGPNIASPEEFGRFLAAEARKWSDIIKATNIKIE